MRTILSRSIVLTLTLIILTSVISVGANSPRVMISEVAWSGTRASWGDEWIELYNTTDKKLELSGWKIIWGDSEIFLGSEEGNTVQVINSYIPPEGVMLLERTDDGTVATVSADIIYTGGLPNSGTRLALVNSDGQEVQVISASDGWPAGTSSAGEPKNASMELVKNVWKTHKTAGEEQDKNGDPIFGSPGKLVDHLSESK